MPQAAPAPDGVVVERLRTRDEQLVERFRAGDQAAFEAIVLRYRPALLRYCRRLLSSRSPDGEGGWSGAEDAVQDVFVRAYGALRADDREMHLRAWLYRVAHNVCVNALLKHGSDHEPLDPGFDGVLQPPEIAEGRRRLDALVREMSSLPERQRTALVRRELEGRSYEEIAGELDATRPGVRQLLARARHRLRAAAIAMLPLPLLRSLQSAGPPREAASLAAVVRAVAAAATTATLVVAGAIGGPPPNGGETVGRASAPAVSRPVSHAAAAPEAPMTAGRVRRPAEATRAERPRRPEPTARARTGSSRRAPGPSPALPAGARAPGPEAASPTDDGAPPSEPASGHRSPAGRDVDLTGTTTREGAGEPETPAPVAADDEGAQPLPARDENSAPAAQGGDSPASNGVPIADPGSEDGAAGGSAAEPAHSGDP